MTADVRNIAIALRLHHQGRSVRDIARGLALPVDEVWDILRRAGSARPAHFTRASARGETLKDPQRADAKLRRF